MSAGLHTLGRWTADRAIATPGRTAILDTGVALTYRELEDRATRLAERLIAAGYRPGERIATLSGNSSDHVVLFFACAKSGLVLTPLSWRLRAAEVAVQLETADPALLVVEEEFGSLAAEACALLPLPPAHARPGRVGIEEEVPVPHRRGTDVGDRAEERAPGSPVQDEDPVLMPFTSGTEGASKAVVLTHANCFWNNLALSRTLEITSSDVVLAVLPQFHTGGWNIQPLLAWWSGATVVMERTFDAGRVLSLIEDRSITTLMAVPAQYLMLAEHPRFAATDLSSLRLAVVGGAAMPPALMRVWHGRDVPLVQGYGLTEAGPNVLSLPAEDARERVGWMGRPYPHVEVAVADPATGRVLDGPATGELLVGGPSVFAGYFRDPGATARALAGGWLHTGDLVERDAEGYFRIVDRLKDIFVSGGENVVPAEVEQVLTGHPAVAAAAVIGMPHERWGETGHAFVVRRAGVPVDETELREHCTRLLAGYKRPTEYTFVPELPRTGLEKIARGRLRPRHGKGLTMAIEPLHPDTDAPGGEEVPTTTKGTVLTARGLRTRRRLLDAAEKIFADLGYPAASIVKITEEAGCGLGTFYLYFEGKQEIFNEVVLDLNRRVRRAMNDAARAEADAGRIASERAGFRAFFRFTAEHPALYRIIRQAEFASPDALRLHYSRIVDGYAQGIEQGQESGEIHRMDPEVVAWALMGIGEIIGMRWVLWPQDRSGATSEGTGDVPDHVFDTMMEFIERALAPASMDREGTDHVRDIAGR